MRPTTLPAVAAGLLTACVIGATAPAGAGPADPAIPAIPAVPAVPSVTAVPAAAAAADAPRFPTARTAGVPPGWQPRRTVQGDVTVSRPGAVVRDLRVVGGDLVIAAPDVTVVRSEVVGGVIDNFRGTTCQTGLSVRATTIRRAPGQQTEGDAPALGVGGYTARRVLVAGLPEGFRVGGKDECGPVRIIRSLARVSSPTLCDDWHGDALQGYDGGALTVRDSVLVLRERDGCGGTAPFFYPGDQGNTSVDVDGLVVSGGGYPFRLGTAGTVHDLFVVGGSWGYGPTEVGCGALTGWSARVATLRAGQPVRARALPCRVG